MSKRIIQLIVGAIFLLMSAGLAFGVAAEKDKEKAVGVDKTTTNDDYKAVDINTIFNLYSNNGDGSYNKYTSNAAFEFPKGTLKTAIFEEGVVWGGFHKGRAIPKVGGSVYRHGLQAGKILTPGTLTGDPVADDPLKPEYHVYRVRPDVGPTAKFADMESKMQDEAELIGRFDSKSAQDVFNDYLADWNNWPAKSAANPGGLAPFTDVNGDGLYDPNVDIPGQPGADQTLYYVANDMNSTRTQSLAGCPPIGMEMHRTIWAYNRQGSLGQTIFASTLVINKSGAPVDSMFFVQWSDPDLGDSGDDFAGCDTSRNLGFVYNGKPYDATYGTAVPSAGYDFFQGPLVPAAAEDSAVFRLQYRHGFRNLPMTTFVFFTQGFPQYGDPAQGPDGDRQWYRLMNGLTAATGAPFVDPTTGKETKFTLYGDPVTGSGWLDGMAGITAQDRRMCLVSGPFTMAAGDTQELVVASMIGLGADRISSVAVLKWYSDLAQFAYDNLFNIPSPPPAPKVNVANLNNAVSLSWGDPNANPSYQTIESHDSRGYKFEGYNVYQLPDAGFNRTTAKRLATYDLANTITTVFDDEYDASTGYVLKKPVLFGSDSGIKRQFTTTTDAINSRNLVNGTTYYFAVTAYAVNLDPKAKPSYLESAPQVLTVVPQTTNPGTRLSAYGDTVKNVAQTTATGGSPSEGQVIAIIVDPTRLTGDTYSVTFHNVTDTSTGTTTTLWNLTNTTKGTVVLKDQTNQTGDEDYPVVDGMLIKVTGPLSPGMKDYTIPAGSRRWTWVDGDGWGMEGFNGAMGNAFGNWFSGSTIGYDKLHNTLIKLAAADGTWDPKAAQADANFSRGYRYVRAASNAPAKPEFAPWITNPGAGYAYQDYNYSVPFSAWDEETNPSTRLMVGNLENNGAKGLVDGRYWPPANGAGLVNTADTREFFFIFATPYSETPDPAMQVDILNVTTPMMWIGTPTRRNGANFSAGDEFEILASHLNTPANTFTFTSPKPTVGDVALAKVDVEKINVFPNPYVGFNPLELNKYERFVTFNHLPARAIVRVFNIAGTLIRTLRKDDPTQYFQWDLRNENGFPVAAGMYVVYIDMPDIGKTKTLKLGVIPEQQFIDRW